MDIRYSIFFISLIGSILLINLLLPFLKQYLIDKPNFRSSHKKLIPRGGGISFVFIITLGSLYYYFNFGFDIRYFFPILCLPLAIVGFIDDLLNIKSIYRLLIQLLTAIAILYYSPLVISSFNNSFIILFFFVTLIVSVINFVNFMDGIDGLVASCMLVSIATIFILRENPFYLMWSLGALLGFLTKNWSPAKVFMGDVGSTYLGAYYSCLLFQSQDFYEVLGLLMINGPLFLDASFCVIRRIINNQNPFKAHRLHLYQRLVSAGLTHNKVSIIYCISTFVSSIVFINLGLSYLTITLLLQITLGIYLEKTIAKPFSKSIL